ncbi:MAG: polyprenyl synthetase family protein [Candidatus Norongarragalinales archaeon]
MVEMNAVKAIEKRKPAIERSIARAIPRRFDENSLLSLAGKPRFAFDFHSLDRALAQPIWDLLDRGGKRWRPALLLMVAEAVGGKKGLKKAKNLVVLSEVIHEGSLLTDDVEDDSALRRGKPCIHKIYGVDVAVNAGNAMYFLPLRVLRENEARFDDRTLVKLYEAYARELTLIHLGQALDIAWHKGWGEPTEQQYLQMCAFKTGTLARLSAKLGAIAAGGSHAQVEVLGAFAEAVGVAFQIQDDVLNVSSSSFGEMKGFGEDIHEGKRTLLVIHAFKVLPPQKARRLRALLDSHPSDSRRIREAIALLREANAIEYAKAKAREIVSAAWRKADGVLKPSKAKQELKALADFLVEREL